MISFSLSFLFISYQFELCFPTNCLNLIYMIYLEIYKILTIVHLCNCHSFNPQTHISVHCKLHDVLVTQHNRYGKLTRSDSHGSYSLVAGY